MTTQGSRREAGASKGPRDGGTSVEGGGSVSAPATPEPYYDDGQVTIYHGDCREILPALSGTQFGALVTDPPYGDNYRSGAPRLDGNARSIANDDDTTVRDEILEWWVRPYAALRGTRPALVFGKWRITRPAATRGVLVWDKGGALGMGDLALPWKFDHEEIYVIGGGFVGSRDCGSVVRVPPVQSVGRSHPHEKPVALMQRLLVKVPGPVIDPCMGVGSTLVAAKTLGMKAVGIELSERYCEAAAKRLSQGTLDLGGAA